jgi:hypothetical protein
VKFVSQNEKLPGLRQHGDSLLLLVEGATVATMGYDKTGRLIESITFEDKTKPPLKFSHENSSLVAISEGDAASCEFVWKKVSFLKRGLSVLLYPYYLHSDGRHTYSHGFHFEIARMAATDATGGREEKTYSLKTGGITDKAGLTGNRP